MRGSAGSGAGKSKGEVQRKNGRGGGNATRGQDMQLRSPVWPFRVTACANHSHPVDLVVLEPMLSLRLKPHYGVGATVL